MATPGVQPVPVTPSFNNGLGEVFWGPPADRKWQTRCPTLLQFGQISIYKEWCGKPASSVLLPLLRWVKDNASNFEAFNGIFSKSLVKNPPNRKQLKKAIRYFP